MKFIQATTLEWYASIFGACLIAFGLGVYLESRFEPYIEWLVLAGALLHGWGMYKMHKRNT